MTSSGKTPEHEEQMDFIAVQYEVGEMGTPHYQGFLILKRRNRLSWLKNNFSNRAHWEKTRGSDIEAYQYCIKDDTHPPGSLQMGERNSQRIVRRERAEKN